MIVEILLSGHHASNSNMINLFLQNRNACRSHWSNTSPQPNDFDDINLPQNRIREFSDLKFRGEKITGPKNETSCSVDASKPTRNQDLKSVIEQGLELEVTEGKINLKLSRGDLCAANLIPAASQGNHFCQKSDFSLKHDIIFWGDGLD